MKRATAGGVCWITSIAMIIMRWFIRRYVRYILWKGQNNFRYVMMDYNGKALGCCSTTGSFMWFEDVFVAVRYDGLLFYDEAVRTFKADVQIVDLFIVNLEEAHMFRGWCRTQCQNPPHQRKLP